MKTKNAGCKKLLEDLSEIKAVIEVEAKLMRSLMKMAVVRQEALHLG